MKKKIRIINVLFLLLFLISCTTKVSKKTVYPLLTQGNVQQQAIAVNKSFVSVKVLGIDKLKGNNYKMKVKTLSVKSSPGYPSIAVINEIYNLTPNFAYDESGKLLNNRKNKDLIGIVNSKKGKILKLEIFLSQKNGWMIQKVLSNRSTK